MSDSKKVALRVTEDTAEAVRQLAQDRDCSITEAAEALIAAGLTAMVLTPAQYQAGSSSILSQPTAEMIEAYAAERSMDPTEMAHKMVVCAIGRWAALAKDKAKNDAKKAAKAAEED